MAAAGFLVVGVGVGAVALVVVVGVVGAVIVAAAVVLGDGRAPNGWSPLREDRLGERRIRLAPGDPPP